MARCAVIGLDNVVQNIVIADPVVDTPPDGTILVASETASIGWIWDGSVFTDPTPPPVVVPVPVSITPRQCRLVLMQQGLLQQVEDMIAQSTDDVRITWEYALEFRRDDPLLAQLAANLTPPLTSEQIDQFFIAAAQL